MVDKPDTAAPATPAPAPRTPDSSSGQRPQLGGSPNRAPNKIDTPKPADGAGAPEPHPDKPFPNPAKVTDGKEQPPAEPAIPRRHPEPTD